jgi:hypothetical protein
MPERIPKNRIGTLWRPLQWYITVLMRPTGEETSGLSEGEAINLLVGIHDEAIAIVNRHLSTYYAHAWNEYRLDVDATAPTSTERIEQLCAIILEDVQACVERGPVSLRELSAYRSAVCRV